MLPAILVFRDKAHGTSGSVLEDMIHRTSHTHPLYKQDNASVFTMIEEATRGTHFGNTIQPFKRGKNGRGAWKALLLSHVGGDKWESITKTNSAWLITTKWNEKKYSLELFCSHHRSTRICALVFQESLECPASQSNLMLLE